MKYILFEKSAIELLISKGEFQSVEFTLGRKLIDIICEKDSSDKLDEILVKKERDKGMFFVGKNNEKTFLVFDLLQCKILEKEKNSDRLLLALQKVFRTAIRLWNNQSPSSSERIHSTKAIVFPFVYSDKNRLVIERSLEIERLKKRGIVYPLLVYKYGIEDGPRRGEVVKTDVLKEAGQAYLESIKSFRERFSIIDNNLTTSTNKSSPILYHKNNEIVGDGGFSYLNYEQQLAKLTTPQRQVVEDPNICSPIRIEGPAGTGKTASMILRAFRLLREAQSKQTPFKIIFFAHSITTKNEIERTFSYFDGSESFLDTNNPCHIEFTTLFDYCIKMININESQIIESDVFDAKQYQRLLIADAYDKIYKEKFKTFRPLLSNELKDVLNEEHTPRGILLSMLQHEFSVQIKGRTDGTIEEYYSIQQIENALPTINKKDKEFIFSIFMEYQNILKKQAVYDSDDIVLQALSQWNAPIWRRERGDQGFDYIFVDEMHLFNINEQYSFHYLTKWLNQSQIPICFALDYSQAIGDRGNISGDYIEQEFSDAKRNNYRTVFRSSQEITDFCAAISASGALMFQSSYKNPYDTPASGFTQQEENICKIPQLFMYRNDNEMINSLNRHIDKLKQETQCKNYDIAIVSFEDSLLDSDCVAELEKTLGKKIKVLRNRVINQEEYIKKSDNTIILSDPYNVNGLEFKCVILVGVDEGRVPQNIGVSDVSGNYIKYIAFNQLYLTSSRAKYRLVILGNKLHGVSSCLEYSIANKRIQKIEK